MKKIVLYWSTEARKASISVDHLRSGELTLNESHIISQWRKEGVIIEVRYAKSKKIKLRGDVDFVFAKLKEPSKFKRFSKRLYFLTPEPPIDF